MTYPAFPAPVAGLTAVGRTVDGFGSATGTPGLPDGFSQTFRSHLVRVGELDLHVVTGGTGSPVLLLGGWPQFWFQWRLVMPALAANHAVIAVDPRGTGLSDKPAAGYDSGSLAAETCRLMTVLGHERFAVVSHDVGGWTAYAMAVDEPDRITRLVISDTLVPGLSPSPPLFGDDRLNTMLWHYPFNRVADVNERLVSGREDIYFGNQFATKSAFPGAIPDAAVKVYVRALQLPGALRASFEFYRALTENTAQNERRKNRRIRIPVLGLSAASLGLDVGGELARFASDVTSSVIEGGHFLAEENPADFCRLVAGFLDK